MPVLSPQEAFGSPQNGKSARQLARENPGTPLRVNKQGLESAQAAGVRTGLTDSDVESGAPIPSALLPDDRRESVEPTKSKPTNGEAQGVNLNADIKTGRRVLSPAEAFASPRSGAVAETTQRRILSPEKAFAPVHQQEISEYEEAGGGMISSLHRGSRRIKQTLAAGGAALGEFAVEDVLNISKEDPSALGQWLREQYQRDREEVQKQQQTMGEIPSHPTMQRAVEAAGEADGWTEATGAFLGEVWDSPDTAGFIMDQAAELAPQIATFLVGTKGADKILPAMLQGVPRIMATMGTGGFLSSIANTFGPNVSERLEKGLGYEQAEAKAALQSLAQGSIDAATGAVIPLKIGPNQWTNIPAQTMLQMIGGATGEIARSKVVGETAEKGDVIAEGLLEVLGLPGEAMGLIGQRGRQQDQTVTPSAPQTPSARPGGELAPAPEQDETALTGQPGEPGTPVEDVSLVGESPEQQALADRMAREFPEETLEPGGPAPDAPAPGSVQDESMDLSEPLPTADVVAMAPDEEITMEGPADPDLADFMERQQAGMPPQQPQQPATPPDPVPDAQVPPQGQIAPVSEVEGPAGAVAAPQETQEPSSPVEVTSSEQLNEIAQQAATSPENALTEPTEGQKRAGNYRKPKIRLSGHEISIENPKGSVRSGTDRKGRQWSQQLKDHYGYLRGVKGRDKDNLDVFLTDQAHDTSRPVFVVDQVDPATGRYDEAKVVMGATNEKQARRVYQRNYEKGWQGLGAITRMSQDEFKQWTQGDTTKPAGLKQDAPEARESEATPARAPAVDRTTPAQKPAADQPAPARQADEGGTTQAEETTTAPEKPTTPKKKAKKKAAKQPEQKIEDFGEVLEGARKHYAQKLKDAESVDIAAEPLSKSWPEPNYQQLLDEGIDPWAVAFVHAARDAIPRKPVKGWKLKPWVKQIETLRGFSAQLLNGEVSQSEVRKKLTEYKLLQRDLESIIDLYQELGHEHSLKDIRFGVSHYTVYEGQKYKPAKEVWEVTKSAKATAFGNMPRVLAKGDTKAEAIDAFKRVAGSGALDQSRTKNARFDIYSRRNEPGVVYIGKKIGRDYVDLEVFGTKGQEFKRPKDGFEATKSATAEAREYLKNNQGALEKKLAKLKEVPDHRKESNSPRVGVDHRNGADVTPEQFTETFGFRGVQFGNYVEGSRRQQDLNETYDALMDLAGILNLPARALSLNGELGLAFGARGKGGKRAAKAHFEPGNVVINLTKKKGAGSLAHEWWHSLDNYFARQRGESGYLTENAEAQGEGVRPEMVEAFKQVTQAINRTRLRERSRQLDKTRTKPYWQTGREMSARSFESYVIERLRDQEGSNDYLANIVSEEYWEAAAALGVEKEGTYPYPEAAEIPVIRAAFDNFFQTVETRETDQGTAMFSEDTVSVKDAEQRIRSHHALDTFSLSERDGSIVLNNMVATEKGEGSGTAAMQDLVDYADQTGRRIILTPGQRGDGTGTTSAARLKRFYKRFGFVENKGRNKDFSVSEGMYREPQTPMFATAYHGSPHKFDRFDLSRIGTGEGGQAFGYGIYIAENPEVANTYRLAGQPPYLGSQAYEYASTAAKRTKNRSEALDYLNAQMLEARDAGNSFDFGMYRDAINNYDELLSDRLGHSYTVDIPDSAIAKMLDWDKPLSKQAKNVREAFSDLDPQMTGQDLYSYVTGQIGREAGLGPASDPRSYQELYPQTSQRLNEMGIPGIKYLDQGSRTQGEGTRNFVIFDDSLITILERNGEPVTGAERDQALASMRGETTAGMSVTDATNSLRQIIGKKGVHKLFRSGRFNILPDQRALEEVVGERAESGGRVKGMYDPASKKSYLVAGNIRPDELTGVFLHEVGAHYGLPRMIGKGEYFKIKKQLQRLYAQEDPWVVAAYNRVPKNTPQQYWWDEVLAYTVEQNHQMPALRRMWSKMKAFLKELGVLHAMDMSSADMVELVRGAAGHAVRTAPKSPVQGAQGVSQPAMASKSGRRVSKDKLRDMGMDFENLPGDQEGSQTRATEPVDQEPDLLDPEKALEQIKKKYGEPMLSMDEDGREGMLPEPQQQERAQRSLTGNRINTAEKDSDGLVEEDPRLDPVSRDMIKLVGFFESATDKLRRSGSPLMNRLATRVDAYYDRVEARMGWINGTVRPILKRIPAGKKKSVMRDFEEYWRHYDNGREQEATDILNRNSIVRSLVSETKNLYSDMGDLNQKVGVQVYDAALNDGKGGWRKIGKVPKGRFWPRAFSPKVQRVLSNPKNDPEMWRQMVDALINEGHIETPDQASKYLRRYMGREVANDYFSGIEKARKAKLPEMFYDYSWDAFNRYARKWATRATQIEQFGQKTGPNSEDAFETVINSTMDAHTQNYVAALADHVYSRRSTDIYTTLLQHLNLVATGTQLGNPATATLNFLGGTTLNVQMFGWRRVIRSYSTMMKDWNKIQQTGVNLGILGKDVLNILRDTEQSAATYMDASGRVQDALARFAKFTMTWGGYRGTENIIRTNAMVASWIQLQDALHQWNQRPKSSISMKYRAFMQRNRIDPDKLLAENGEGPETARYLRLMVNIPQGSYRPDQVPLYVDSPVGRFLFKYQKFGTQVSRMFWQNHLQPFVKTLAGGEKVLLPGQRIQEKTGNIIDNETGKVVKSNRVRTFLPLLRYFVAAFFGGSAILAARSFLFNYVDPGPEWEDLAAALEDDDEGEERGLKWALIFDRAYYSLMAASAAGFFGNYWQFVYDVADQQRAKNPLEPPGLASLDAVKELALRFMEQGKLTGRDLDNVSERTLALYRGYKRPALKGLAMSGSGWKEARLQHAYSDLVYARKMTRRYADEMGMKGRRTSGGRWGKTPMSPINQQIYENLLLGDGESARAVYDQVISKAYEKVDPDIHPDQRDVLENPEKIETSVKSSVRARHPWNVGASQSRQNDADFRRWAEKNASKANFQRLQDIAQRYERAKAAAGL